MIAVILSGGKGLRLRPLTDDIPKVMVRVNGRTLAEHQLNTIGAANPSVDRVVFACGYRWERIKEAIGSSYGRMRVEYSIERESLGTAGALKSAMATMGLDGEDALLVCNGDVLTDANLSALVREHLNSEFPATMLLVPFRSPYGVVRIDKLKVVRRFDEKPVFEDSWINGGWYALTPRRVSRLLPDSGDLEETLFPELAARNEIQAFVHYGFWQTLDTQKDLAETEMELKAGISA